MTIVEYLVPEYKRARRHWLMRVLGHNKKQASLAHAQKNQASLAGVHPHLLLLRSSVNRMIGL